MSHESVEAMFFRKLGFDVKEDQVMALKEMAVKVVAVRFRHKFSNLNRQSLVYMEQEMKNPGIDLKIWENLRKRWTELDATGHTLKVDFQLVGSPKKETDILAIDVIQHIDDEIVTETVQRKAGEAHEPLGIAGLSLERLTAVYKGMLEEFYRQQAEPGGTVLVVTMSPSSETSGEIRGYVQNSGVQSSVLLNYQHYYVLNALREKMIEAGKNWSKVRAMYDGSNLEFSFDE